MASRGGRGGRGWRGRGRGGPGAGPVALDDEGNALAAEPTGPPQLYPEGHALPKEPQVAAKEERLLARRNGLLDYYRSTVSAYHQPFPAPKSGSVEEDIMRYSDVYRKSSQKPKRAKLSEVLHLDPKYFPLELYTTSQQRQSHKAKSEAAQSEFFKKQSATQGLSRLEQLAQIETSAARGKGGSVEESAGQKANGAVPEDEDDDDVVEEMEEEEEYDEDDDYVQGEAYDDDDGYDDGYDDGEGEAYF